ncbi:MAG: cyclic nucleotide-binding domain-containing protein, partial [Candidatus Omnitrophica bacterium]|nr:cyclic nucleotide-binding domain-containing protein [Candidatus Omnitrophota bacterium]
MKSNDLELILDDLPIFSGLSSAQRRFIRNYAQFKEFKKGQIIYREGSQPDAFYCLLSGRVLLYTGEEENKTILEYLHRGKYFGIISLLTGEPHSVTAQAVNDSVLLVIPKEEFNMILEKIPSIAVDLGRSLSRRLKRKDIHQKTIFETTLIGIFSHTGRNQKNIYSLNLALGLGEQTKKSAILLEIVPHDTFFSLSKDLELEEFEALNIFRKLNLNYSQLKEYIRKSKFNIDFLGISYLPEDKEISRRILGILSFLVNDYHYIILDLFSEINKDILYLLNQMDQVHILTNPDEIELRRTNNLIERLEKEFGFLKEKIKIIITEYKLAKLSYAEERKILGWNVFATLPHVEGTAFPRLYLDEKNSEYYRTIRRISRQ